MPRLVSNDWGLQRLELTSLRLTYNATARDLVTALVTVLIQSIDRTHLATSAKQVGIC